jgi:hypothetical protein
MKPRWRFWHNYLVGIPRDRWRLLRARNEVDPGYRHRAAFLGLTSFRNSMLQRREEARFGAAIEATRIQGAPLFVIGHWRSGTTHLHNLLACDREQFAAPNSIQVSYPHYFLLAEEAIGKQFTAFVPSTRPMDNVRLDAGTPQEDEFAMCAACQLSPFLGMGTFPRRAAHYDRYLAMRDAWPEEVAEWKSTFLWFLKKLTLKHGRPLLLKSPTHTARIGLLLDLFPGARFVHIHRNPYAVFQSTTHLLRRLGPIHTLQRPPDDLADDILTRHNLMYDAYFEDAPEIPAGQFCEVSYEALVRDPVGQVRAIYERLALPGFEAMRPGLEAYVASLNGYRTNEHAELSPSVRSRVARAWQRSFERWMYSAD